MYILPNYDFNKSHCMYLYIRHYDAVVQLAFWHRSDTKLLIISNFHPVAYYLCTYLHKYLIFIIILLKMKYYLNTLPDI